MKNKNFSKDFTCNSRETLVCPFGYLDGEVYRCSYYQMSALASGVDEINYLLSQACDPIKDDHNFQKYLARIHKELASEVLKNAQIGDLIFCFDETHGEVILLEKPDNDVGNCTYKTKEGKIKSKPIKLFRTISQGTYSAKIVEKGYNCDIRAQMIKRIALEAGFRVEIEKLETSCIIRIFGNTQREVDDFINLRIFNKLTLV